MYNFVLENVLLQYYFTLYTLYMRQFGFYCVLLWNTNSVLFTVRRLADKCILFMVPNKQVSVCTTCRTPVYRSMLYSQFIPSFVMYIHRSIIYSCFQYSPSMARKNNTHTQRRTNKCLSHSRCSLQLSMTLKIVLFVVFYAFHIIQNKKEYYIRFIWELEFYGCRCCVI